MTRYFIGAQLTAIGTLRILDTIWPVQLVPWPFYAAEILIGLILAHMGRLAIKN